MTDRTWIARAIPCYAHELADTIDARRSLVAKLERVVIEEERRNDTGHWAYDHARHNALRRALHDERAALERIIDEMHH